MCLLILASEDSFLKVPHLYQRIADEILIGCQHDDWSVRLNAYDALAVLAGSCEQLGAYVDELAEHYACRTGRLALFCGFGCLLGPDSFVGAMQYTIGRACHSSIKQHREVQRPLWLGTMPMPSHVPKSATQSLKAQPQIRRMLQDNYWNSIGGLAMPTLNPKPPCYAWLRCCVGWGNENEGSQASGVRVFCLSFRAP